MNLSLPREARTSIEEEEEEALELLRLLAPEKERKPFKRREGMVLTPREVEVMTNLCLGLPDKEIAQRLDISEGTVGNYLISIYTKLGVTNRVVAALRFLGVEVGGEGDEEKWNQNGN